MEFLKKYSYLKYVIICLLCFAAHKADGWFLQDNQEQKLDVPIAETVFDMVSESSFSAPEQGCRIPRQTRLINSLRTFSQANRSQSVNGSRYVNALARFNKTVTHYFIVIYHLSFERFPSGLSENRHRLISLGKLII